jgi:hypothetical protein
MPAPSSSPIDPVLGHLADLVGDAADDSPGLLAVLAGVADPRHRRGVGHKLAVILGLAVCAVLAGARSFVAIAEWAADTDEETLAGLGVTSTVPSESTFRRTLQRLDADAFDDLAGEWAAGRTAPGPGGRRAIAVDGKTLRGSGHGGEDNRHLLAAFDHAHGVVLGQAEVGAKTNEIPLFSTLLAALTSLARLSPLMLCHAPPQSEGNVVSRDLLRGHLPDRHPGNPRSARRHHRRPLGH